jgi:3-oxoacyl-[acyl-carrier protein] reductase
MKNTPCILITGTSKGLGLALAQAYLEAGEHVVGCSRGASAISHVNYHHHEIDVSNDANVTRMFTAIREAKLVPRLLINNAGLTQKSLATFTNAQSAQELLGVNLLGAFLVSKEAIRLMQRHRFGRIVNLTSINVPLASVGSSLYNASKAGLDALGHSLAVECKNYDITVNSLGLSLVAHTGMADSLDVAAIAAKCAPLLKPNLLETAEIMAAINFFAANEAKNITGQQLYFGGVR